jgi:hypothetical protein
MPFLSPRAAAVALWAAEAAEAAERIGRRLLEFVEAQLLGLASVAELTRWRALFRAAIMARRRYALAARRLGVGRLGGVTI